MERLTANQFVEKLKTALDFQLEVNYGQEPVLRVLHDMDGSPATYLGPNPLYSTAEAYADFAYQAEAVMMPRMVNVDLTLPRLDVGQFISKIQLASQWMTKIHEEQHCIELILLTTSFKFEHYISEDLNDMGDIAHAMFLLMLDHFNQTRS